MNIDEEFKKYILSEEEQWQELVDRYGSEEEAKNAIETIREVSQCAGGGTWSALGNQ